MIVETLSDHPGAQLRKLDAQARRRAADRPKPRWWQFWLRWRRPTRSSQALAKARAQAGAGVRAEDLMTAALAPLSDEWTLLRGYRNGAGELDHLLIGPWGVWAVEVKMKAVTIFVDGDDWSFVKFDRYGNQVDSGPLADRSGRSWGRQVGDVAERLEELLAREGRRVRVHTAVAVINERAKIGRIRGSRVEYLGVGRPELIQHMRTHPDRLDPKTCRAIVALAKRDHAFHTARRARRGRA